MVEEPLARRQEAHAARRTLEERRAELVFEHSQLGTERRLGDAQRKSKACRPTKSHGNLSRFICRTKRKSPALVFEQIVREAKEVERLGFPFAALRSVSGRKATKFQQPRLFVCFRQTCVNL